MPFLLAGAAVAGPILGGIIGNMASEGDREAARAAMAEAVSIIDQVPDAPDLSKIKIIYDKFKQQGILTPEIEKALGEISSQVQQIQERPELQQAQMDALRALQARGKVGLAPEDKAALNQIRRQIAQDTEAKRQQILQNAAARGMGGSGSELIAQLQAAQSGAETASTQGDQLAALASQRALEAIQGAGSLGGQIRGQEFDIAKTKASSADEIAKFNLANAIARQQRNIQAQNVAQAQNLSEAQRVADINTQMINQEKLRQVEAQRQYWQDQLAKASARAGARTGSVPMYMQQAQQTAGMWQNIGGGVGQGAGALFGALNKPAAPTSTQEQLASATGVQGPKLPSGNLYTR